MKKISLSACLYLLTLPLAHSQQQDPGLLARMTTPVEVKYADGSTSSGTGFFFQVLLPGDPTKTGPQWRQIEKTYVITNKHVIQPQQLGGNDSVSFSLRGPGKVGTDWIPIEITKTDILRRLHVVPDSPIDVAALDVTDLVNQHLSDSVKKGGEPIEAFFAVSKENFPGSSPLSVESGDDVIVIGYPRLFSDEYNKLPILKRGLLITPWGLKYRGEDNFLIDYKGYHGSSGSLVISKPTNLAIQNGALTMSTTKQFLFLGIYSEEPFIRGEIKDTDDQTIQEKIKVDIGQVWYYYTIQQVLDSPALGK